MKEVIELIVSTREKTVAYRGSLSVKERHVISMFTIINDASWYIIGLIVAHYLL